MRFSTTFRRRSLCTAVFALGLTLSALPAFAVPITTIGGTPGVALPAPPSPTFDFTSGFVVFPGSLLGAAVNPLTIDVSTYGADPGPVSITDTGSGLPEFIITNGLGSAVWTIANPAVLDAGPAHSIKAVLTLTSNATGEDFGLIGGLWNFGISIQGSDMTFTPGAPGSVRVIRPSVASFTLELVPEPGTVGLFAIGAIGLVPVIRRRYRSAR